MKRVVVYARYSCDNQTEQSIEGQLRVCQEYAARNQMLIVENYIDRAMSGTNDNRPDFQRMLTDSKKKMWEGILVYKFDRFSRNKYESVIHKKALKDLGISVISAMENIPDSPEGIILESLLEGLNQYYSAELSQKVKRGMRESRLKGRFQGGKKPYGYDIVDHKLVVNEEEAKILKFIFKQYSWGIGTCEIVKKLNRRKARYWGHKFNMKILHKLLSKRYYTGIYYYDGEFYDNYYPKIIEHKIFDRVQEIRSENKYGKSSDVVYDYKKKLFCRKCGVHFTADGGNSRDGKQFRYYTCYNKKSCHKCDMPSYNKDFIEHYLTFNLKKYISNSEQLYKLTKVIFDRYKAHKNVDSLKSLIKKQNEYKSSLDNIFSAIEKGVYNDSINNRVKELELKIQELESIIILEKSKESIKHTIPFIKDFYKQSLEMESISFVYYLIKKIFIDKRYIEVYLQNPYDDEFEDIILVDSFKSKEIYKHGNIEDEFERKFKIFV